MFVGPFNNVREKMLKGIDSPSLVGTWIKGADRYGLSERESAWLAGLTFAGGSDTSAVAMSWWMLAMITYPDIQKRAQAELDPVVGRTRIPIFSDFQHLPYIRAMIKEMLRWRPSWPPTSLDDWYDGMFIPQGTVMIANIWHLNRDPTTYGADVAHFNPEEGHISYGFGRRVYPGKHVANNSLFIDIAMMLWACNIEAGKDEHGNVIPIDVDGWVEDGLLIHPVPFVADISPRFPEAVALLTGERELTVERSVI
ncbi:cytochrome P450 [Lactarius akahatsu]|uniref:Cytochrome P450 n=1 Tax=Lactarius akahatsu TaxID=416441 RepID=A0AAD4LLR4_9AGAM|nr:cytochrome P450 [Lactarius akahatsu]